MGTKTIPKKGKCKKKKKKGGFLRRLYKDLRKEVKQKAKEKGKDTLLHVKSHGQRSLVGCGPQGR